MEFSEPTKLLMFQRAPGLGFRSSKESGTVCIHHLVHLAPKK